MLLLGLTRPWNKLRTDCYPSYNTVWLSGLICVERQAEAHLFQSSPCQAWLCQHSHRWFWQPNPFEHPTFIKRHPHPSSLVPAERQQPSSRHWMLCVALTAATWLPTITNLLKSYLTVLKCSTARSILMVFLFAAELDAGLHHSFFYLALLESLLFEECDLSHVWEGFDVWVF